ncbi:hypothetical protein MMC30_001526 [Trapelia coarctata]|nr:hypothetical protein [Trapelia coarctata]
MLEIFGRNVEGEDWQRHRKITTPPFNERNNGLVWTESLRQAGDMLTSWIGRKDKAISSTAKDAKTLSLHVLAGAGLGKFYTFQSASDILGKSNSMDYRESLYTILQNAVLVIMFSPRLLLLPFMPSKLRHVGKAIAEFNSYMMGVLAEEKEMVSQRKPGTGNLMSSLVRASEEEVHSSTLKPSIGNKLEATNHKHGGLTADEILGNMFIFNSAGHETTANTLAYGILLLAAHPEWQDWIAEELDCVLNHENSDSWNYESVFPRLKRCLAVMFETLRLYSPVLQIPKYTGNRDRYLEINGRGHYIPRNTLVVPNAIAVQSHPRYWGEDANTWRPSRWIDPPLAPGFTLPRKLQIEREVMHVPVKGSFIPWSDGPRVCPGKKFAQVEFVAVIARLFHTHRVFPVPEAGEDSVSAMERTLGIVKDSHMTFLLQMRDPSRVRLAWAAR